MFMEGNLTALMEACRFGWAYEVRTLLSNEEDPDERNSEGNTAVWLACYSDSIEIIQLLAQRGANLNNQNNEGLTSLMYASSAGKDKVVSTLLELGANPALESRDGFTALDFAATYEVLTLLRKAA